MVSTNTFMGDTAKFCRDDFLSGLTDPISSTRPSNSKFVLTSYPQRPAIFPIITIRNDGVPDTKRMGMRSTLYWTTIPLEIRVWARNEKERDSLTEQVINRVRSNQFGTDTTSYEGQELHDVELVSSAPVDEEGEAGIKSMVMKFNMKFVLGS